MPEPITVSRTLRIRECGFDENWLQEQIVKDPNILGILEQGELELVRREKPQVSGGRLDFLLTNPDDNSMYEVEVMLGETDETHIIRTIEYWDLERRARPQREHYAVLVAEKITRRFFNVIQLLSLSIPIIAIQVSVVEGEGKRMLHFAKILDIYEEPEVVTETSSEGSSEAAWLEEAPWTVDCAKALLGIEAPLFPGMGLNFLKYYISLRLGNRIVFLLRRRSGQQSLIHFWPDDTGWAEAQKLLDNEGMQYDRKQGTGRIFATAELIMSKSELFRQLGGLLKQSSKRA